MCISIIFTEFSEIDGFPSIARQLNGGRVGVQHKTIYSIGGYVVENAYVMHMYIIDCMFWKTTTSKSKCSTERIINANTIIYKLYYLHILKGTNRNIRSLCIADIESEDLRFERRLFVTVSACFSLTKGLLTTLETLTSFAFYIGSTPTFYISICISKHRLYNIIYVYNIRICMRFN